MSTYFARLTSCQFARLAPPLLVRGDLRRAHARRQRHQREHAALAVVVGAHDEEEVLDRDDQRDATRRSATGAEDVVRGGRHAVRERHALLERVERRGPDVAVDHAERAQRQLGGIRAVLLSRPATVLHFSGRAGRAVALASLIRWLATPDGVVGKIMPKECISATFPSCSIAADSSGGGPSAANLWTSKEPTRAALRICVSQVFAPIRRADLRGRQAFLPRLPVEGFSSG